MSKPLAKDVFINPDTFKICDLYLLIDRCISNLSLNCKGNKQTSVSCSAFLAFLFLINYFIVIAVGPQ